MTSTKYTFETSQAFMHTIDLAPHQSGPLDGLTFAVKDNIDVAGYKTSNGSKSWLDTHPPAVSHAVCVEQLLNAGARCVGKTICDELTHSLDGESFFYGTPVNPKAPNRIPGGSSSGSVSAVACGLVDFALGTDSAGSTRVPASHCGIVGMRPTIHRISESGVLPFAPSSSTVAAFANKLSVLEKVMRVLLSSNESPEVPIRNLYLLDDGFEMADPDVRDFSDVLTLLKQAKNITIKSVNLEIIYGEPISLSDFRKRIFAIIQQTEIWNAVGPWIESVNPEMSPVVREDMSHHKNFNRSHLNEALRLQNHFRAKIKEFMKPGDLFCFPTVPMPAPLKGELINAEKCRDYYVRTMNMTSFSGVLGLPEITIPVKMVDDAPLGLSLVAGPGQDEFLLQAAIQLFSNEF